MKKSCKICNNRIFKTWCESKKYFLTKKYCSKQCHIKAQKNEIPWNKGLKGKQIAWNKGLKNERWLRDGNPNWKGDNVGYSALHTWIKRHLEQPQTCRDCNQPKILDLANISGQYKRELSDWEWLCKSCHVTKDNLTFRKGKRIRGKDFFRQEGRIYG